MKKRLFLFFLFLIATPVLRGQATNPSLLTVDRIFKEHEFRTKSYGPARWLQEGKFY
ncbi:MAG: hypothetical protein V1799_11360 [bacterium]